MNSIQVWLLTLLSALLFSPAPILSQPAREKAPLVFCEYRKKSDNIESLGQFFAIWKDGRCAWTASIDNRRVLLVKKVSPKAVDDIIEFCRQIDYSNLKDGGGSIAGSQRYVVRVETQHIKVRYTSTLWPGTFSANPDSVVPHMPPLTALASCFNLLKPQDGTALDFKEAESLDSDLRFFLGM